MRSLGRTPAVTVFFLPLEGVLIFVESCVRVILVALQQNGSNIQLLSPPPPPSFRCLRSLRTQTQPLSAIYLYICTYIHICIYNSHLRGLLPSGISVVCEESLRRDGHGIGKKAAR